MDAPNTHTPNLPRTSSPSPYNGLGPTDVVTAPTAPAASTASTASTEAQSHAVPPASQIAPSAKGTGILKGTGPLLDDSDVTHRPRPSINYNLKELSHKTRLPAHEASGLAPLPFGDSELSEPSEPRRQDATDEQQPAKRRRLDDGSSISPDAMSPDAAQVTKLESKVLTAGSAPSYFNKQLLNYIWPTLVQGGVTNPILLLSLDFYRPFISLPKVRDLDWNSTTKRGRWTYRTKVDVIALLVQLTGVSPPQCCYKCDPQIGLFMGCFVTSLVAHAKTYYGCANCLYHGTQTYCSLKAWSQQRGTRCIACQAVPAACSLERPSCTRCLLKGQKCSYPSYSAETGPQEPPSPVRNITGTVARPAHTPTATFSRSAQNDSRDTASPSTLQSVSNGTMKPRVANGDTRQPLSTTVLQGGPAAPMRPSVQPQAQHKQDVPFSGAASWTTGGRASEDISRLHAIPSMEKWERAPGRIRSRAAGQPKNIAFSKSYLASGIEVQVCREAKFKVEVIRSGHIHTFKAVTGVTRICSIASTGKLSVKMDGEDPMVIGPHGMFTVGPDKSCVVESEVYDEVSLHITSVKTA